MVANNLKQKYDARSRQATADQRAAAIHQVTLQSYCYLEPHAGCRVVRRDPLHFLAGCRKRRLNQALSALSLSLGFF